MFDVHPVADIFPRMGAAEFEALKADIAEHGQREAAWTWHGQIIDGRHRAQACDELGIQLLERVYEGDESSLVAFVWSLNGTRRHMSREQLTISLAKARELVGHGGDRKTGVFKAQICALKHEQDKAGISDRTLDHARKVVSDGAPELVAAVEAGIVSVSAAATATELPPSEQVEVVAEIEAGGKPSEVIKRHVHVAQNTGNNEWYTPPRFIDGARRVMGSIDTDPATSEVANRSVRAAKWFTQDDDGRKQQWAGNVWMNPPYAQPLIAEFCDALADKAESGEISQACVLVNNATETAWFQRLLSVASAVAFPRSRIRFIDQDGNPGGAPLQGQAIVYVGEKWPEFMAEFSSDGSVLVRGGRVNV